MKIGVVIGSSSGIGLASEAIPLLVPCLQSHEVAICQGNFGCTAIPIQWHMLSPCAAEGYIEELRNAVACLLAWGAKLLICIGGDGLASYVLDAKILYEQGNGQKALLLGIGTGTINAGPIIRFSMSDIPNMIIDELAIESIDAVEVRVDERHCAYAANDVVLGNSFLGILDGKITNLSAKELIWHGKKVVIEPSSNITAENFCVKKNGICIALGLDQPSQIVISPFRKGEFFARAIVGVLCNAPFMEAAAACGFFDTIIVKAGPPSRGFDSTARSEHLLIEPGDTLDIEGLSDDADIIVDGNPFARNGRRVRFYVQREIARILVPAHQSLQAKEVPWLQ